ncbi:MAG: hypothetical protein ACJATD_000467 [Alloalcanivorax sp.]|jgi:hypothetical protein
MNGNDYLGMWYRARARYGVDDRIHFAVIEPDDGGRFDFPVRHREHDGIGGLFHLLRAWNVPQPAMPRSRQTGAPPPWRWLRRAPVETVPAPRWRDFSDAGDGGVQSVWLDAEPTAALRRRARHAGVSLNTLLLLALNQAVAATLLQAPVAGRWLYPVNMRGAVIRDRDDMNLSSGFYLTVAPEDTPARLDRRVRQALADNRHWLYWYAAQVGRLVGQRGVDWLCGRFLRGAPHLGSFTSLGEWHLDLTQAGFSPRALVTLCGPGSPNHPVSNGAMIVNGCLTLSLKLDPVLGADAAVTRTCLEHWRAGLEAES